MIRLVKTTLLALIVAGCSGDNAGPDDGPLPPQEGHAFLTIVGDRNVFIEGAGRQTLTVKYHDESGNPLAGEVTFRIDGTPNGSNLSTGSDVTDSSGLVTVDVNGALAAEASFRVIASAEYATSVDWRIAVSAGDPPLPPLSVVGDYELDNQFDVATGLPGTVGDVVNTFIDMTDDPNDPATWLIDRAVAEIDSGTIRDLVDALRPGLDAYVNDLLLSYAPGFVATIIELGDDFGQIAHKFGLESELAIAGQMGPDGEVLSARHKLTGVVYTVDGVRSEFTMAELDLGEVEAAGVGVTLVGENQLLIGDHTLPLSYGRMLLFALNHVLIPAIDPWSDSVEDLLVYYVDCYAIGQDIADYVGWGSPGLYESACLTGIAAASAYIEDQIAGIDGTATSLVIHGEARPQDVNADRKVDKLNAGLWEGVMNFGTTPSTLAKPNQKFAGDRIGIP